MAKLGMTFDATQVEPSRGAPLPLPTDWYNVIISDSEMKQTKDKQGGYLELTFKILDGPNAGRLAWDRLNLYNNNEVAVKIAQETLSALCHAVGVFQIDDSAPLHGIPLMAKIVEKPPKGGYDAGNDIKGYAKIGEKESKNAQGIVLTPENGDKVAPSTPAAPAGFGSAPPSSPPWGGTPALVPETPAEPVVAAPMFTPPVAAPAAPAGDKPPWL